MRFKTISKESGVALVDLFEATDCRTGIGERFGRNGLRSLDRQCGTHFV
jgi:hypothetical protein